MSMEKKRHLSFAHIWCKHNENAKAIFDIAIGMFLCLI